MSEKKGPFDATIKELEENVFAVTNFLQGCDENNHFPEFIVSQKKRLLELQLAIHVLKAARILETFLESLPGKED